MANFNVGLSQLAEIPTHVENDALLHIVDALNGDFDDDFEIQTEKTQPSISFGKVTAKSCSQLDAFVKSSKPKRTRSNEAWAVTVYEGTFLCFYGNEWI